MIKDEGICRFNCRTNKDAYRAGWEDSSQNRNTGYFSGWLAAYKSWQERDRGKSGTTEGLDQPEG